MVFTAFRAITQITCVRTCFPLALHGYLVKVLSIFVYAHGFVFNCLSRSQNA